MAITQDAINHEVITVGGTAVGLTASKLTGMTANSQVFLTLEGGPIRYWLDGTAPTATEGHLMEVGAPLEIGERRNLDNFRAIRATATDGVLMVSYLQG